MTQHRFTVTIANPIGTLVVGVVAKDWNAAVGQVTRFENCTPNDILEVQDHGPIRDNRQ